MGALDRVFRGRRAAFQLRPLAAIVAGLWKNGEQGVRYDASDLSTMCQDAAGVLPVYMPGQGQVDPPVGLLLDKRLGLVRGPEMLANGDFAAGPTSWTVSNADATHVAAFSGGTLRYQSDTTSPVLLLSQELPGGGQIKAGSWYEVTVVVSSWVSGGLKTDNLAGASTSGLVLASGPGTYRAVGLATTTATTFSFVRNSANVDITVDSISLRELKGNHAYQTTTTSRPTLSARYNLLNNTVWAGAVAGSPGTAPTGWAFGFNTGSIDNVVAMQDGFGIRFSVAGTRIILTQPLTAAANVTYSHTVEILETTPITAINFLAVTSPPDGVVFTYYFNGVQIASTTQITASGRLEMRMASGAGGAYYVRIGVGCSGPTTGTATLARPDVRPTNDGIGLPPYQRVVNASTYDTVGFPLYLRFDGVDDWMQTASIDFTGTPSLIFAAAARKLSDAARGTLFELSSSYSNPGSFAMEAPGITLNSFMVAHTGATTYKTLYRQLAAPVSAVVVAESNLATGYLKLSGDSAGYSRSSDTITDVGGGTYANAPLFIGRRAGSSQPAAMRLYGVFIRSGVSSPAQVSAVKKMLNQKARIY